MRKLAVPTLHPKVPEPRPELCLCGDDEIDVDNIKYVSIYQFQPQ